MDKALMDSVRKIIVRAHKIPSIAGASFRGSVGYLPALVRTGQGQRARWSCVRTARLYLSGGFCSVGAPKNANRQSLESVTERHLTRSRPLNGVVSRDEFSTLGTCASGTEFEASVQHTLEDTNGAQLSEFRFMVSVMPPTGFWLKGHCRKWVGLERKISRRCWPSRQGGLEHSRWTGSVLVV